MSERCSLSWRYIKRPLSVCENSSNVTHQTAALLASLFEHQAYTTARRNLQSFVPMFHCDVNVLTFNTRLGETFICACVRVSWLMGLYAGAREHSCQQRPFFSFLLMQRCYHILAPSQWQLVGMHTVIKQFPVCKWPVYTFLLQSLSLDRLLKYEQSSYTMKNENSKTSIKNPLCLLAALDMLETDVTGKILSFTRPHAHASTNDRKIKATIHNSSIAAQW